MTQKGKAMDTKNCSLGIPETLQRCSYEKLTVVIPVKVWPSLAEYIRRHGGSKFIREALVAYLSE